MKLSELIAKYGDDEVQCQRLDGCTLNIQMTKKGTQATFGTQQPFGMSGFEKMGLIVWLDRQKVKAILAEVKGGSE